VSPRRTTPTLRYKPVLTLSTVPTLLLRGS
jgi:hypothetical protein